MKELGVAKDLLWKESKGILTEIRPQHHLFVEIELVDIAPSAAYNPKADAGLHANESTGFWCIVFYGVLGLR